MMVNLNMFGLVMLNWVVSYANVSFTVRIYNLSSLEAHILSWVSPRLFESTGLHKYWDIALNSVSALLLAITPCFLLLHITISRGWSFLCGWTCPICINDIDTFPSLVFFKKIILSNIFVFYKMPQDVPYKENAQTDSLHWLM
jgi:hypothetical protein